MLKCTNKSLRIANLYFGTDLTMQEIGKKFNCTRQAISSLVIAYIKRQNIRFYTKHIYICTVCGAEVEENVEDIGSKVRKKINTVRYYKTGFICKDCVEHNLVRCTVSSCRVIGHRDQFIKINNVYRCKICNKKQTVAWMRKNKYKWNETQRNWRNNNLDKVHDYQRRYNNKYPGLNKEHGYMSGFFMKGKTNMNLNKEYW